MGGRAGVGVRSVAGFYFKTIVYFKNSFLGKSGAQLVLRTTQIEHTPLSETRLEFPASPYPGPETVSSSVKWYCCLSCLLYRGFCED